MNKLFAIFVFVCLITIGLSAQSPPPVPQGTINFAANFSSFGSTATVNGNSTATASIFTMWAPITGNTGKFGNVAGRLDTVQLPGHAAQIYLVGLEKSWQGGKILRLKSLTFDPNKYWLSAFGEVGGVKQDIVTPSVSARAGVVLRRQLTSTIGLNLAELSYLRTDIGTQVSAGHVLFSGPNNWTAGAGVTLSFGATK